MVDGEGGAGGAGGEVINGGDGGAGGGDGGAGGGAQTPAWLTDLPEEIRGDATLQRYADVSSLAKAHIEAHKVAKSKLVVPGEGATDEDWGKVYDALGRPESPDKYALKNIELPVDAPDEARTALAEAEKPFRELAHKIGLTGKQAEALSEYRMEENAAYYARGEAELTELQGQLGKDYAPKLMAGQKAWQQLFPGEVGVKLAAELDRKVGSAELVKAGMRLAEVMGEHSLIDSDTVEGFGEVKDADAKIDALQADPTWREKFKKGDPITLQQHDRLLKLAQQQALRGRQTA